MSLLFSRPVNLTSTQEVRESVNKEVIAGGVVGGICGAAIVAGLIWFFIWRRQKVRKSTLKQFPGKPGSELKLQGPGELSAEEAARELDAYYSQRSELQADTQMIQELESTTVNSRR